jgi:hypothetical protein
VFSTPSRSPPILILFIVIGPEGRGTLGTLNLATGMPQLFSRLAAALLATDAMRAKYKV